MLYLQFTLWFVVIHIAAYFIAGLMFVYADFCSAIPFSNTIEGFIYMKPQYVKKPLFWTIQIEAVLYSLMFGVAVAWFLF